MQTNSNSIASEIDAIIARAMAEYSAARGIDVFSETAPTETPVEESVIREEPEHVEIPVNSRSLLVSEITSRFSGAAWFNAVQSKTVMLAGLGGIGSYVAFLLSRLNIQNLILFDNDVVEMGNLSGQFYSSDMVGKFKSAAIGELMGRFSEYFNYQDFAQRYEAESDASEIMMCGFDNMEARAIYFANWENMVNSLPLEERSKCLFIDGRLAAESFQVLCIRGDDSYNIARYKHEFIFSDREAEETQCSYKQTSFMANMIASVMVNLFVNFCANECDPLIPRDLPFFTEYTAETMFFKVVN